MVVIFAGAQGFFDALPLSAVQPCGEGLCEYVKANHPRIPHEIEERKVLSEDVEAELRRACETFVKRFQEKMEMAHA